MSHREPARRTTHRPRIRRRRAAALLGVAAAIAAGLGDDRMGSSSSTAAAPVGGPDAGIAPPREPGGAPGEVPGRASVFDDGIPRVAKLDPALLDALRRAAADASRAGVDFVVESGWRSPELQRRLLREAVSKYGSEEEAARWVAAPETSAHVSGDAVDIGPEAAQAWLSRHGAAYGLCQVYVNEPWHFELRPEAIGRGCPPMYADPTHDPRMRR